ncbi:hypothetical protein SAY87_023651 [Trapa incisa]|uniref:HSF-type DNA-binding domain-containing protein n=1 Tax=Trapa incisa TaxID=236973 RepID=A0AAN7L5Z4_9MYRT|nr:hypothetical protein SAY87_023651 [Trapa incisa]
MDDPTTDHIVSWSPGNNSFIVWDYETFSISLLPKAQEFLQLRSLFIITEFSWESGSRWEYANEGFFKGKSISSRALTGKRKPLQPQPGTSASSSRDSLDPCIEVGVFGLDQEINRLNHDKQVLMVELVSLQQQQASRSYLRRLEQRLQMTSRSSAT